MNQHDQEQKPTAEVNISIPVYDGEKVIRPIGLVSVGLPVRNGGQTLRHALDSILRQDYQNLEIIISDNDSTDNTALVALEYQKRDSRIIYHRQPQFLPIMENFRFVLDKARGEYFMWAAHDDTRSRDYVSGLLRAMRIDPEAILSFGDIGDWYVTNSIESEGRGMSYCFDNTSLGPFRRMRKQAHMPCAHLYGLWRTEVLRSIRYYFCPWGPELPMMTAAAYRGKFKYVPGPKFSFLEVQKNDLERTAYWYGKGFFSNKYSNKLGLIHATYKTSAAASGMLIGMVAALFVAERIAREKLGLGWSPRWKN